MMTELEKLKAGLNFCYDDAEIIAIKDNALTQCEKYNAISPTDKEKRYAQLKQMFGKVGENPTVEKNFHCDNGKNIFVGDNFLANYNVTILDVTEVHMGNNVLIGPHTLITTVSHPISLKGRRQHLCVTDNVIVGDDVWIGGNVTILPGVTIGNNVVIGAGSVVTKDIPCDSLVMGVPARIVRKIDNNLE